MRGYHVEIGSRKAKGEERRAEGEERKAEGEVREEVKKEISDQVTPKELSRVLPQKVEVSVSAPESEYSPSTSSIPTERIQIASEKTTNYKLQTTNFQKGPRTNPQPDDLEIWGIILIVVGIVIGVLSIPFWETALTSAYILLGLGGALFMAGLVCLFIYDPEACFESCAEIFVEAIMAIILGILCGAR